MKRFLVLGLVFMALGCKQTKKQPNNAEMISDSQKNGYRKNPYRSFDSKK
ncbi:hypothetical protein QIU18_06925 [Capnocytophaga canimorsus]|nr:hypothetical protein [Capnocytophaga canimorsus]WGU71492.1 hypothetical protein QIU18_06925 [Capnocytophaga canimorsus]